MKVGSKSWILTCSCNITLSLPFYTNPASKRELNFCNGYLSLLYFWGQLCTKLHHRCWIYFCMGKIDLPNLKSILGRIQITGVKIFIQHKKPQKLQQHPLLTQLCTVLVSSVDSSPFTDAKKCSSQLGKMHLTIFMDEPIPLCTRFSISSIYNAFLRLIAEVSRRFLLSLLNLQ